MIIHDKDWSKQFFEERIEHAQLLTKERYAKRPVMQRPVEWLAKSIAYFL
ncbi:hypothetical protein P9D34_02005 [Bacillus swezeyi]|nr:hypothetical protein [Bacillus swezeyi]MEC1259234.1 hypothetical protein [Bacillus swezeyi]MED2927805.1 hypothetical protein [Bacillus swezeyi]MED2942064.1 hypothetical protein [Bacillus swezeyi]MED2965283.1 hypothetical protein [Bacillus swezeyi]MED2977611.1 hypothetical protein [Bacillus swezeyi]